ncbi:AraC family transcriptional regulator [Cohnella sp.]|uniref:AraC family transcriptional regulator n=1 Tax=Cohnella sp. TaxID=1883426 RepID=UPI0035681068
MENEQIIELQTPPTPYYLECGQSQYPIGYQHPNRRNLGVYDLLVVVSGTLHIGENDQAWALSAGQTLLLLPDREHYSVKPCEEETVFYWIHFNAVRAADDKGDRGFMNRYIIQLPQRSQLTNLQQAYHLIDRLLSLRGEHRSNAFWQEQKLLLELLRLLEEGEKHLKLAPSVLLAERTEAYLRQNYQASLSNETLSKALHFHPNYIVRCMKETYHCTPMEYLHEYRLNQAMLFLIATEWSIAQIAEHVGFQYVPYFSSCFKERIGVSPLKYRKGYSK